MMKLEEVFGKSEIHLVFEILALMFAPAILYIGFEQVNTCYKYILIAVGLMTILIDGALISSYFLIWWNGDDKKYNNNNNNNVNNIN